MSGAEIVTRQDLVNLATKADLQAGLAEAKTDILKVTKADLQAGLAEAKTDILKVTKADLQAGLAEAKADILKVTKADLQAGLAETKADILKWMVGTIGVQTAAILGAANRAPAPHALTGHGGFRPGCRIAAEAACGPATAAAETAPFSRAPHRTA